MDQSSTFFLSKSSRNEIPLFSGFKNSCEEIHEFSKIVKNKDIYIKIDQNINFNKKTFFTYHIYWFSVFFWDFPVFVDTTHSTGGL